MTGRIRMRGGLTALLVVAASLVMAPPALASTVGNTSPTSQAYQGAPLGAVVLMVNIAYHDCRTAANGDLVLVRGLPVSMQFYKCDGVDLGYCKTQRRRLRKLSTCIVYFGLRAILPVDPDKAYVDCNNTIYAVPRVVPRGTWRRVSPINPWNCHAYAGMPAGRQYGPPGEVPRRRYGLNP